MPFTVQISDTGAPLDELVHAYVGAARLAVLDVEDWERLTPDGHAALRAIDLALVRVLDRVRNDGPKS